MVKTRFSTADVAAQVACLKGRVIGFRINNVYDISSKVYMFKLNKSGGAEGGETQKDMLILESGARFHMSKYTRDKNNTPSNFCLKLRKHIRGKRIESVKQLGVDRIVDFQVGSGAAEYHLILELYSQGNLVLTDANYKVLTLLRSHRDDANEFAIMANHPYPVDHSRSRKAVTVDSLAEVQWENLGKDLKSIVSQAIPYGPQIAEHCIHLSNLDPKLKLSKELTVEKNEALVSNINQVEAGLSFNGTDLPKGYIFLKVEPAGSDKPKTYESFEPLLTRQAESKPCQMYDTFNDAVDEFYSSIECQKQETVMHQEKKQITGKLEKIKIDQDARITSLRNQALSTNKKAQLIEYNLESVDAAINAVNEAIASGFDWLELEQMIQSETEAGNPVAQLVHSLQLSTNSITLRIRNNLDYDEEENQFQNIQVNLNLSAHANACALYQQRKKHEVKENKTIEASEKALKAAEKQASSQMKKMKVTSGFKVTRKTFWFEKFDWFISSENYLVVSGRDAQQNELIVKRYLTKHDIYVHADIHGAASCIIRNRVGGGKIPPTTLLQAGTFCVCHSQAWNSKFTTGSWWVYSHQVSKTAPSGEYLQTGSFMIRGKKNFLQPTQLLMGFTMLFRIDEDCVEAHLGERTGKDNQTVEGGSLDGDSDDEDEQPSVTEINEVDEDEDTIDADESTPDQKEGGDGDDDSLYALLDTSAALNGSTAAAVEEEEEFEQVGDTMRGSQYRHDLAKMRRENKGGKAAAEEKAKEKNQEAQKPKKVRGKRGKKKKMKKYADQDDEDRALAMMLLGSAGNKPPSKAAKTEAEVQPTDAAPKHEEEQKESKAETPSEEGEARGREEDVKAEKDGRRPSQETVTTTTTAGAESTATGNPPVVEQQTADGDIEILNTLTGLPREDDILLYCIPMCAPYMAVRNNKFMVKLTPGQMKKGKSAKQAMEMIKKMDPPDKEYQLLRSIPEQDLINAMLSNSKPSIQGKDKKRVVITGKKKGKRGRGKKKR